MHIAETKCLRELIWLLQECLVCLNWIYNAQDSIFWASHVHLKWTKTFDPSQEHFNVQTKSKTFITMFLGIIDHSLWYKTLGTAFLSITCMLECLNQKFETLLSIRCTEFHFEMKHSRQHFWTFKMDQNVCMFKCFNVKIKQFECFGHCIHWKKIMCRIYLIKSS